MMFLIPNKLATFCQVQGRHNLRGFSIESLPTKLEFEGNQYLFEHEKNLEVEELLDR